MIEVALVVEAERKLTWHGAEVSSERLEALKAQYGPVEDIELLEGYDEYAEGAAVRDPHNPAESGLSIRFFFPREETPEKVDETRLVDVGRLNVVVLKPPRKKCARGNVYLAGGEAGPGFREVFYYDAGFFPPFKPEDVTVYILDLFDFGYDGYMLTKVNFAGREACYSESEIASGRRLATRLLED
ncbi:MAG: hypothetical protein V1816_20700 [Pseudomonadota bacterium]